MYRISKQLYVACDVFCMSLDPDDVACMQCQRTYNIIPSFCSPARESDDACDEVLGQLNRDGQLSLAAWFCDFLTYPVGIKAFVGGIPLRNMLEKLFIMMLTQELIVIYIEKDVNKLREHYKHINVKYENI